MKRLLWMFVLGAGLVVCAPTPSHAEAFTFSCITGDSATDVNCNTLETQVLLEVTADVNPNLVNFRFTNIGDADSSIADVYFSDLSPALLGLPSYFTSSSGVSFSAGCAPGTLPGGGFVTSYCADSDSPAQPNGINPTEWLNIQYTLQDDATFDDVFASMNDGTYRVGVHVQGFANGGSESGIVNPVLVPEPASMVLVGTGALGLLANMRRRKKQTV